MAKYPVLFDGVNPEAVWNKAGGTKRIEEFLSGDLILVKNPNKWHKQFGQALVDFEFTVPEDYHHDTQIDTFTKKTKTLDRANCFNENFTSAKFARATNKLVPGKTYRVRIFPIITRVSSQECFDFLAKHSTILVGGQGITLLQQERPEDFPKGKYTVSFDRPEALWVDSHGRHRVPIVYRYSDGDWDFSLGDLGDGWLDDFCLLCVSDPETLGS